MSWLDVNRHFFVMLTCGIWDGDEINHSCLHQLDKSGWAAPDMVIINVPQPKAIETYYKSTSTIDLHNRIRADDLRMERNLATKYWDKRINLGIFGIVCIDTYLFSQQVVHTDNRTTSLSRIRRVFAQHEQPSWIKRPLPLPPSRHLRCGGHFASKRKAGGNITLRDGASAADARSRQPTYATDACTLQMDHRSSFGSAMPRRWKGASVLLSTLTRQTWTVRNGGGGQRQ
jgi:hypothetical protein